MVQIRNPRWRGVWQSPLVARYSRQLLHGTHRFSKTRHTYRQSMEEDTIVLRIDQVLEVEQSKQLAATIQLSLTLLEKQSTESMSESLESCSLQHVYMIAGTELLPPGFSATVWPECIRFRYKLTKLLEPRPSWLVDLPDGQRLPSVCDSWASYLQTTTYLGWEVSVLPMFVVLSYQWKETFSRGINMGVLLTGHCRERQSPDSENIHCEDCTICKRISLRGFFALGHIPPYVN